MINTPAAVIPGARTSGGDVITGSIGFSSKGAMIFLFYYLLQKDEMVKIVILISSLCVPKVDKKSIAFLICLS